MVHDGLAATGEVGSVTIRMEQEAMPYDYIKRQYGIIFKVGDRVRHTEIDKIGTVARINSSHGHYVQVKFDGAKHSSPCHPQSLDFLRPDAGDGPLTAPTSTASTTTK